MKPQRILVFQQEGSAESKIRGIRQYGGERFIIETYDIDAPLPSFIEDGCAYLPDTLAADLVLDYLRRLDLSHDLWSFCERNAVPVVASSKKGAGAWAVTPRTCCALPKMEKLGAYGRLFGAPELEVTVTDGRIAGISVRRGAPCGATWDAARRVIGVRVEEAPAAIGLTVQYHCTADPSGWDVMHGRSAVHIAAELHSSALKKAIDQAS